MDEAFDPVRAGAVAVEQPKFDPVSAGAIPVEHQPTTTERVIGGINEVVGAVQKGQMAALNPASFLTEKLVPESVNRFMRTGLVSPEGINPITQASMFPIRTLSQIVFGKEASKEPLETTEKALSELASQQTSPENLLVVAGTAGAGAAESILAKRAPNIGKTLFGTNPKAQPTISDTIYGKTEVEPPLTEPIKAEPIATEQAAKEVKPPEPSEAELAKVNMELAPTTEPPEAIAESFPSISRSAENQRRIELQQEPPKVREAISLDELRLMRERNELQLQNDLSKRATGTTHPAVDERLNQIDDELTKIANRELQIKGGGEINATQEGQIAEGGQPEYTGNVESWTPTEAGNRGGVEPSAPEQGQTVAEVPLEQPTPVPNAEGATTAQPLPQTEVAPPSPATVEPVPKTEQTGIAERYREEEQPGSVIPGAGVTPETARTYGQEFINKGSDPYTAVRRAQAGNTSWRDVGVARAEYERLGSEKRAAEDALEKEPNNPQLQEAFNKADDAQRKWSKDAQPILTRAGDALRAATRSYPREINSFSDFTDIVNDHYHGNVELTPKVRADLQKAVRGIKNINTESNTIRSQVTEAVTRKAGGKFMSFDDLKADLKSTVETLLKDCVI